MGELEKLSDLARVSPKAPVKASRTSKDVRKAAWSGNLTPSQRQSFTELLSALGQEFGLAQAEPGEVLSADKADTLMSEWDALTQAAEAIEARREQIKRMVHESLNADYSVQEVEDPEATPGKVIAPKAGKAFSREGGGRAEPTVDLKKLAKNLSKKDFAQVTREIHYPQQIVAARVETVVDESSLIDFAVQNPDQIEAIMSAMTPGKIKPTRIQVRDYVPES